MADKLSDAVWEINKIMPLMSDAEQFPVSRKNINNLIQARLNHDIARQAFKQAGEHAEDIQCPVCGYYCLGKGGYGCIDKPKLVFTKECCHEK